MSKLNENMTQLDTDQIAKKKFDESIDADRVYLVGGDNLNFSVDSDKISNAVRDGIKSINFQPSNQQVQTIEKNVFIPQIEFKEIEKQVFITQIEYKVIEIEKPIIVKEIEIKEIIKEKDFPKWFKVCAILQTIATMGYFISRFIK